MKSLLTFTFCCIIITISAQAQIVRIDTLKRTYVYKQNKNNDNSSRSEFLYTIGIKALGFEQFPKILNQTNSEEYLTTPLNGLVFKFNDNQLSYRFDANLYTKDISFTNECEDCERLNGKLNDLSIKMGFEKNIIYTVIQPYFGADLGFRRNNFNGESTNINTVNYTPYGVKAEKNGAVFGPFVGIKLNIINRFTIAAESGIDLMYSYERQEKMYHDANKTKTFKKYTKYEFLTRPLTSLSLQYNFGFSN